MGRGMGKFSLFSGEEVGSFDNIPNAAKDGNDKRDRIWLMIAPDLFI